jgi:hypothetical protein
VKPGDLVAYWRPGGRNLTENYFYNGSVLGAWRLSHPDSWQ